MRPADRAIARMFDANANRAAEGLRTVEDVLRFAFDNRRLSREARNVRHALARISARVFPRVTLLAARDSGRDVGAGRSGAAMPRRRRGDLLSANMKRAQESVRVMEETARYAGKPAGARALQALRFRLYRLERSIWSVSTPR